MKELAHIISYNCLTQIYAAITFSDSDGNVFTSSAELSEQETAHQICINLAESPTGSDLVVTITTTSFGTENDFQLSESAFTFLVGTNQLRQCFDITLPLDNLLEQREFFQLNADSSSSSATLIVFILDADGKHFVKQIYVLKSHQNAILL